MSNALSLVDQKRPAVSPDLVYVALGPLSRSTRD